MNLTYFKKVSVILLLGFIFIINTIPVSFAELIPHCPSGAQVYQTSDGNKMVCPTGVNPVNAGGMWTCPTGTPYWYGDRTRGIEICYTEVENIESVPGCTIACNNNTEDANPCVTKDRQVVPGLFVCVKKTQEIQQTDLSGLKAVVPAYIPRVEIPCNTTIAGGECPTNWKTDLGSYVGRVYQFGLMIAGLIAFGMIIFGAAQYTLSAGGFAGKEEAKETILNAIYGLLLLFGAYLVLYTINPNLVKLGNIQIDPINLNQFNAPTSVYISGDNNTVSESSGTSGIPGCLVAVSETGGLLGTGFQAGLTITSDQGVQQYGTSPTTKMLCTKCTEAYTLKDGACVASFGVCARGADSSGTCCAVGTSAVPSGYDTVLKKDSMKCVAPCPIGSSYDSNAECTICITGYAKLNSQCVKTTFSGVCPSHLAAPDGQCIPQ